jgi:hypothetical protein
VIRRPAREQFDQGPAGHRLLTLIGPALSPRRRCLRRQHRAAFLPRFLVISGVEYAAPWAESGGMGEGRAAPSSPWWTLFEHGRSYAGTVSPRAGAGNGVHQVNDEESSAANTHNHLERETTTARSDH